MFKRPEAPAILALGVFSVALLLGSVILAFAEAPRGAIYASTAELPESLFVAEPQEDIAPVAEVLAVEAQPIPSTPTPEPPPSQRVPKGAVQPKPPSSQVKLKMDLTFASEVIGTGKGQKIRYTAVVSNVGEGPLQRVRFASHIPAGTVWVTKGCEPQQGSLSVSTDGGPPTVHCLDPSAVDGHEVDLELEQPLQPNGKATLVFEVSLREDASTTIVDHAHVTSGDLSITSGDVITEIR